MNAFLIGPRIHGWLAPLVDAATLAAIAAAQPPITKPSPVSAVVLTAIKAGADSQPLMMRATKKTEKQVRNAVAWLVEQGYIVHMGMGIGRAGKPCKLFGLAGEGK